MFEKIEYFLKTAPEPFLRRHAEDPEAYSKARTIFWYTVFWTAAYCLFLGLNILWQTRIGILYYIVWGPVIAFFWVSIFRFSIVFQGRFISYVANLFLLGLAIFQGGFYSPAIVWSFTVVPVASYAFASSRTAIQLTVIALVEVFALYLAQEFDLLPSNTVPHEWRLFNFLNGHFFGGVLTYAFMSLIERDRQRSKNIVQKAHEEVLQLKETQDGDYFLTSLILHPLQSNSNQSQVTRTETLIQQKKRFVFKERNTEIGGDICITDNLVLMGRQYTFFLNGDAMGKSLQGAGGAIVLGAVFKSILTRNQRVIDEYPEVWLRETFRELQKVFESFDGSMLMSAVFGLVDDRNGWMYFINAEHPGMVLYRGGQADFVAEEPNKHLMKIGVPDNAEQLHVNRFHLKAGDVLYCGSDGRDDIRLADGSVNSDEQIFRDAVEKSEGDLSLLLAMIQKHGTITDDLSLLKIDFEPEYDMNTGDTLYRSGRADIEQLLKAKDYANARNLAEDLIDRGVENHIILYYLAQANYRLNRYREGLKLAERIALISPDFEPNQELRRNFERKIQNQR